LTNVLDRQRLSDETAAVLYGMRWGVEIVQAEYASSERLYQLAA
jgi:hypothetical protein